MGIEVVVTDEFLEADNDMLREECTDLWKFLHELVKHTRSTAELNHPVLYKRYEQLCQEYGEPIMEAKLLGDGMKGKCVKGT